MNAQRKQSATVDIKIRMKEPLRRKIEKSADHRGISMNADMVDRIERSFEHQELWASALELDNGPRAAALMRMIEWAIGDVGRFAGFFATNTAEGASNWLENPNALKHVKQAVSEILDAFLPEQHSDIRAADPAQPSLGILMARGILEAVKNPDRGGDVGERARPIREKLGELAPKLRVDDHTIAVPAAMPGPNSPAVLATMTKDRGKRK